MALVSKRVIHNLNDNIYDLFVKPLQSLYLHQYFIIIISDNLLSYLHYFLTTAVTADVYMIWYSASILNIIIREEVHSIYDQPLVNIYYTSGKSRRSANYLTDLFIKNTELFTCLLQQVIVR